MELRRFGLWDSSDSSAPMELFRILSLALGYLRLSASPVRSGRISPNSFQRMRDPTALTLTVMGSTWRWFRRTANGSLGNMALGFATPHTAKAILTCHLKCTP